MKIPLTERNVVIDNSKACEILEEYQETDKISTNNGVKCYKQDTFIRTIHVKTNGSEGEISKNVIYRNKSKPLNPRFKCNNVYISGACYRLSQYEQEISHELTEAEINQYAKEHNILYLRPLDVYSYRKK